ncbi:MAG: chemotaxis protein CheY [Phycisphaerae bacterium]|nr:MAG: chemotaxis protein CheY [Phycisphaerae bacterium]
MAIQVLVVDDAAFMRHMLQQILVEMDCEIVAEAGDGKEAIEAYQKHRPDLVTLDLVMPNMGGLEALEKIRELDPKARVIVISAIDQRSSLMQAVKLGAVDYVVKPFDRDGVKKALNRAMETIES